MRSQAKSDYLRARLFPAVLAKLFQSRGYYEVIIALEVTSDPVDLPAVCVGGFYSLTLATSVAAAASRCLRGMASFGSWGGSHISSSFRSSEAGSRRSVSAC
jgi:hypothetical protein